MSQKSLTVIYLPGLGGRYDRQRQLALRFWPKRYNARLLPMHWTSEESYQDKKARVHAAVEQARGQVILIGESAGAAIGLVVASENPRVKFIAYCGKIGGAASTGEEYYERVPAFRELLPQADDVRHAMGESLQSRVVTVRAYKDLFLSERDTSIPGVRDIVLPSIGHLPTIIVGLTLMRYGLFRAIKLLY